MKQDGCGSFRAAIAAHAGDIGESLARSAKGKEIIGSHP